MEGGSFGMGFRTEHHMQLGRKVIRSGRKLRYQVQRHNGIHAVWRKLEKLFQQFRNIYGYRRQHYIHGHEGG